MTSLESLWLNTTVLLKCLLWMLRLLMLMTRAWESTASWWHTLWEPHLNSNRLSCLYEREEQWLSWEGETGFTPPWWCRRRHLLYLSQCCPKLCEQYDKEEFLLRFIDDIYNYKDFHSVLVLREELRLPSLTPLERISHRWLSINDTERLHEILHTLSLFYFVFLTKGDQTLDQ